MKIDLLGGIEKLEDMGVYDVILPFLLVFVLVFAILEKIKIFGEQGRKFNIIIALVIGFLLVRQGGIVEFINTYLPNVSAVIIVFLGFLILLGLFGVKSSAFKGGLMVIFVIVSLIGGIWALTQATEGTDVEFSIPGLGEIDISESDAGALVVFGAVILIIIIAVGKNPRKKSLGAYFDEIGKVGDRFAD